MSTPRPLCGFLLLALLAGSHAGQAQTSPQCANAPAPVGATLVKQGNGTAPAPSGGQPAYSQTPLNLSNYAVGGLLTIRITAGNGVSAASFELFSGNTAFPANGAPSTQPLTPRANVAPGSCATLTYNFSQAGNFILAATGASGSNTFQYAAYVQPSFTGVFSASAPSGQPAAMQPASPTQPAAPQPTQPQQPPQDSPQQGEGIYNGVFSSNPGSQPTQTTQPVAQQPAQPVPTPAQQPSPTPPGPPSPSSSYTLTIQSVSIQNSPGVPDLGGHSILGGLLRGTLTAVEPNLVLCVTPTGTAGAAKSCSGICNPGHDCTARLSSPPMLPLSNHSVHVEVLDNDKQGQITPLGAADLPDAMACTESRPCPHTFPDSTSPDPAHGTDSTFYFTFGQKDQCHGPYSSIASAMQLDSYGLEALNSTGDQQIEWGYIVVRDPSAPTGGYYTTPPVQSQTMRNDVSVMDLLNDYARSAALCPKTANFLFVATVHTHPESLLKPFNRFFSTYDYSQSVEAMMANNKIPANEVGQSRCIPQQGLSSFEEIVMIYAGDRSVRTFKPRPGDCSFSDAEEKFLDAVPASPTWYEYMQRTCILPWAYADQAANPAALTVPGTQQQLDDYSACIK